MKIKNLTDLKQIKESIIKKAKTGRQLITVCGGTGCHASGCKKVIDTFNREIKKRDIENKVEFKVTGCHGFCEKGPIVVIHPKGIFYQKVQPQDIKEILSETVLAGKIIDRLLYVDPLSGKRSIYEKDVQFYKGQHRIVFGKNGLIDPYKIEDYFSIGGYESAGKALCDMHHDKIIDEVKKSGLRGRGGAGFPTGFKWDFCRKAKGDAKYIICNADEGDPGAYMDRSLLEGNPHSILEGMIIGAYAIGANEGFVYIRIFWILILILI